MLSIKVKRAFATHGFSGIMFILFKLVIGKFLFFTPKLNKIKADFQIRDQKIDSKWGVETSGAFLPNVKDVEGNNWIYGIGYQGCDSDALNDILKKLTVEYDRYTFIDLGSGKGRAIITASFFPFKEIIGVEYSKELNLIADRNLEKIPSTEKKCKNINIILSDAEQFKIPDGPLIIFLYNPFGKPVMEKVLKNIEQSLERQRRNIFVLYFNPVHKILWKKSAFFNVIFESKWRAIFNTNSEKL